MKPSLVKNPKELGSKSIITGKKRRFIIKSGKKLGEVFNYLPHGVIDKTETGIGGTTLELDAKRDSIVVQPYVFTAYSKAQKKSLKNKHDVFFYGRYTLKSTKDLKSKKISISDVVFNRDADENLTKYIAKCKKNNRPVKITCVTDQLQSLKNYLNSTKKDYFNNFHLVLDEIDSLQEQSNFRNVMDDCFSIYKSHPEQKRTVISATLIKFNDPKIKNEAHSKIEYDKASVKNLCIVQTHYPEEEILKQILEHTDYAKGKIVIACNYIKYCINLADSLKKEDTLKGKSIKILCSPAKKNKLKEYFSSMNEDGTLPADINFITAAYFNGFDINEQYHNIIIAENLKPSLRLSPSVMYQISGRGRKGLLSNKLLVKIIKDNRFDYYTYKELKGSAKEHKAANDFVKMLTSSSNKYSRKTAEAIKNIYTEGTEGYPPVTSVDTKGKIVISYLKIDSRLEQQITHKNYQSINILDKVLATRFNLTYENALHAKSSVKKIKKPDPVIRGGELLDKLEKIKITDDFNSAIKTIKAHIPEPVEKFEHTICDIYNFGCNEVSINSKKLINLIKLILSKRFYHRGLNQLKMHLDFNHSALKNKNIKNQLSTNFPVGKEFTVPELQVAQENFADLLKELSRTLSPDIKKITKQLCKNPKLIKDVLLKVDNSKRSKKERKIIITGYNLYDIKK